MRSERLLDVARGWFDERTVSLVFEPLIADLGSGKTITLLRAFATAFIVSLPKQLQHRVSERVLLTGWGAMEAFTAVGAFAIIEMSFHATVARSLLLPAVLAMAIPAAIVPAAVLIAAAGPRHEARAMTLRVTLLALVILVPLLAFVAPAANRTWRDRQPGNDSPLPRGVRELSLAELFRAQPPADLIRSEPWAEVRATAFSERAAVAVTPITMMFFGLAVSRRRSMLPALPWALGAYLVAAAIWLSLSRMSPWLPQAVLLIIAMGIGVFARPLRTKSDATG